MMNHCTFTPAASSASVIVNQHQGVGDFIANDRFNLLDGHTPIQQVGKG
jgi:hypothetical protein